MDNSTGTEADIVSPGGALFHPTVAIEGSPRIEGNIKQLKYQYRATECLFFRKPSLMRSASGRQMKQKGLFFACCVSLVSLAKKFRLRFPAQIMKESAAK